MMQRRFDSRQNVWENPRTCEEIVTVPNMANHNQLQTLTCLGASELHPKGHRSGSHQPQPASALSSPMETCNGSSKHQVWKPKLVEPSTPSKHMGSDRAQGAREAIYLYIDYIYLYTYKYVYIHKLYIIICYAYHNHILLLDPNIPNNTSQSCTKWLSGPRPSPWRTSVVLTATPLIRVRASISTRGHMKKKTVHCIQQIANSKWLWEH